MSYMDQSYIDENHVVQRYVHGKLSADELVEFEKYMLLNPDIMQDIELVNAFKTGFEQEMALPTETQQPATGGFWHWLWPGVGAITGAMATWLFMGPLAVVSTKPVDVISPEVVYIESYRGVVVGNNGASETIIDPNNHNQVLVIDISGMAEPDIAYTVELLDENKQLVQQWPELSPNARGELIVLTQLDKQSTNGYWLTVKLKGSEQLLLETHLIGE